MHVENQTQEHAATTEIREVAPGIFAISDTCMVYVILSTETGDQQTAVAIDFGSGAILDHLDEMGVDTITDVLMTHHHRDQAQGLPRAVANGIAIHVPPVEQDLFAHVNEMWRTRPLVNDYNLRQDRFSLLESVPISASVPEYRRHDYSGVQVEVLPTPGHTTGSVTYLLDRGGQRYAFTGDLIYAPGKVWSLAATQWSYTENEGPAFTVLSCYLLAEQDPDLLLPSHGHPMADPKSALNLLAMRMQTYVNSRRMLPWDLRARLENPYTRLTEHVLMNTSSTSCSYVVLSDSGAAMIIDFGYDMVTGNTIGGSDRAARRPWLASLRALRRDFGVTTIDIVLATHYHDDHVAGMNLLRDVEGTEVWAPSHVAAVLQEPERFDLPCLWHDPIPVDRSLALGESFGWREYTINVHDLPGHTLYAAAFELEADGVTVLVTGDQQQGRGIPGQSNEVLNYQYRSLFRPGDYQRSAALYREVAPGLMLSGHWGGRWVDDGFLDLLSAAGDDLVDIHSALLPDDLAVAADSGLVRIEPYRSRVAAGATWALTVHVRNPYYSRQRAEVRLVLPEGWCASTVDDHVYLDAGQTRAILFRVQVGDRVGVRTRVAADVTIGDLRLGQHSEALVDVGLGNDARGEVGWPR